MYPPRSTSAAEPQVGRNTTRAPCAAASSTTAADTPPIGGLRVTLPYTVKPRSRASRWSRAARSVVIHRCDLSTQPLMP